MKQRNKDILLKLVSFCLLVILISCKSDNTENKKEALKGILELQRTDKYTVFSKFLLNYNSIIDEKWKESQVKQQYKNFVSTEIHNDGVFYNREKDTIYFLSTLESWISEDVKLPDSLKVNASKKITITSCFLGIRQNDSIIIQKKINPIIYYNEIVARKRVYNEQYRKKILDKFIDYVIKNKEVSFNESYFERSDLNKRNFMAFKPLYSLIE